MEGERLKVYGLRWKAVAGSLALAPPLCGLALLSVVGLVILMVKASG